MPRIRQFEAIAAIIRMVDDQLRSDLSDVLLQLLGEMNWRELDVLDWRRRKGLAPYR